MNAPHVPGLTPEPVNAAPRLKLTPLSSVQPRHQRWLWKSLIPDGELTLGAGPEGVGKSTWLAWLAASLTNGSLPGDLHGQPRAVLIAALEDDNATTLRPRMEAAGADLDLVGVIAAPDGNPLRLPDHLPLIEAELRDARFRVPVGAILLDPVKGTAPEVNPEKESEVRPLLSKLAGLAQRYGVAVVPIAHFKKGAATEDFAAWKVSGTPAWTQLPRSVLFFSEDPEADEDDTDARVIAHAKCNVGRRSPTLRARVESVTLDVKGRPLETSRLVIGEQSRVSASDLGRNDREQRTAEADAADFLRGFLSDGEQRPSAEVIEAGGREGHSEAAVKRATSRAGVVKRREGSGKDHRSLWSIPAETSELSARSETPQTLTPLTQITQIDPHTREAEPRIVWDDDDPRIIDLTERMAAR